MSFATRSIVATIANDTVKASTCCISPTPNIFIPDKVSAVMKIEIRVNTNVSICFVL